MPESRVIVIGLDACDKDLALTMMGDGRMPNLARLQELGAWQVTDNPPGLFMGAVWPSFFTGCSPAGHGRYCYLQIVPGTYDLAPYLPSEVKGTPLWTRLSKAGRTVAVIDVPHTCPTEPLNGMQLIEWGVHDAAVGFQAWPASLAAEITDRFGGHPTGGFCDDRRTTSQDFIRLRDDLLAGMRSKVEIARHYLAAQDWDLFLTVFSESHCAGHQCWHLHDPAHREWKPALKADAGDVLEDIYCELDASVGAILEMAGPDTTVLCLLSHGMGPQYDGDHLLDEVLRRLALADASGLRARARALAYRGWYRLPTQIRVQVHRLRSRRRARPPQQAELGHLGRAPRTISGSPWARDAYQVPNNEVYSGIRVNLAGREPQGTVQPGEDMDRLCSQLSGDLMALVNPRTGGPAVQRVLRTSELFAGPELDRLPDLLVEWCWDSPIDAVRSSKIGLVRHVDKETRTGDHRPAGLLLATGPSVRRGQLEEPVRVEDLAPTICALLGVGVDGFDGFDGRPVDALAGP